MPKKRYVCSIMAFSPSPTTGERINVGVVVGSDEEGYGARAVKSAARAKAIDDAGQLEDPETAGRLLGEAQEIASEDGLTEGSLAHRADSTGNLMSSFKILPPIPILEWNLEAALDRCVELYIVEP